MKISNKLVEVEADATKGNPFVTLRFPLTKAQLTLSHEEARELWKALDMMYGPA